MSSAAKTRLGTSFGWFNATQFLGALNDNIFKLLTILFLIRLQGKEAASNITALAGAVFVVPFLLFMATAGKLADRFSKRNIIVWAKAAEVVVMAIGCAAFLSQSVFGLYCVLFLMAAQSAFFAPAKYGIVPELVKSEQLSRANGLLEALTYLAIVIGTALGPFLSQTTGGRFALTGIVCVAIAILGLAASLFISRTPAIGTAGPVSLFFLRDIWRTLRDIRGDRDLLLAVIASAYFLLMGGFTYSNLIPYGIKHLGLSETQSGYLFVITAVGIGVGSFWAGRLSGRNVEFGVVPLGAIGLTLSSAGLGFIPALYPTFALVFIMGVSAGLFIVPINTFIQLRSPAQHRGQILAASNFLGWVGVLLASGLIYCLAGLWKLSAGQVFMILGIMTLVPTVATIVLLPDFLVRFLCILLTRLCYRIKITGIENIPTDKSALLVCNHVSWVDALLLAATQQRRIRFIMDKRLYTKWWLRPIARLMKVIPISATDSPKKIVASLRQARAAMDDGFLVCIFAEGMVTRSGMMAGFKGGFERIMRGSSYDIIPVYLGGLWGSIFSYYSGKILSTLPRKLPYPVSIHFGVPLPADSSADQIRQKVAELSCEYFDSLKSPKRSLAYQFVKTARKNWSRRCISDSTDKHLNYGQTLISAIVLADMIGKLTEPDEKIGILLPPSAGGAIANLAVTISGRVAVNLNYTASQEIRNFAIEQCGIKCVISSRRFMEKTGISGELNGIVFLEDIAAKIGLQTKIKAYLKTRFLPVSLLAKSLQHCGDDLAAVIFSSGSSGRPKGVMLSHHNIISNIEAVRMVVQLKPDDSLCGVLPFFHSFGFNCSLWLPLISGVSVGYIANPLDGPAVGKSVCENRSTILFAPPTFLLNYIRRAKREDFSSLRLVVAGAEKLKKQLADMFEDKFGIRPLEGYGATELSPVVSLNIPDVEADGVYQVGTRESSVGHPIPGVAAKIVSPETKEPLAVGKEGLLLIKGPNVMLGYIDPVRDNSDGDGCQKQLVSNGIDMPQQTAEVLKDGWYDTGDIAKIDTDGFITITDRLFRFSKIAGEMVSHVAVEQVFLDALGATEQVVAVTAIPDDKKGEELVVLHLEQAGSAEKLHELISKSSLPNLWKPRASNYIMIKEMPTLGSGKLDIVKLKEIALSVKKSDRPDI
jgi:acyl-[acyl-carrier-protein]-phospholipid O-acyltransferase/long-chain-fatty-acid--[acyl-carrier-protein] ligase